MPGSIDNTGSTGSTSYNTELPSQAGQTKQVGKSFNRTISLTKNEPGIPVALNKLQEQKPVPQGLQHNTISKESTKIQTLAGKSTEVAKQRLTPPSPPKKGTPPTAPSSARPPGPPVRPPPLGTPPAAPSFARPAGPPPPPSLSKAPPAGIPAPPTYIPGPPPPTYIPIPPPPPAPKQTLDPLIPVDLPTPPSAPPVAETAQPASSSPILQNSPPAAPGNTPASPLKNFKDKSTGGLEVKLTNEQHEALAGRFGEMKLSPKKWKEKLLNAGTRPPSYTAEKWNKLNEGEKVAAHATELLVRNKFINSPTPPRGSAVSKEDWMKMTPAKKRMVYLETVPRAIKGAFTGGVEVKLNREEAQSLQTLYKKNMMKLIKLKNNPPNVVNKEGLDPAGRSIAVARYLVGLNRFVKSPARPSGAAGIITEKEWKSASKAKREIIYNTCVVHDTYMRAHNRHDRQVLK